MKFWSRSHQTTGSLSAKHEGDAAHPWCRSWWEFMECGSPHLAIPRVSSELSSTQSQSTSANKLRYSVNTLALSPCYLADFWYVAHMRLQYTSLSANLVVPAEIYTYAHLHTYEGMQTEPYLCGTLEGGGVLQLLLSYRSKERWTKIWEKSDTNWRCGGR